MLEEQIGRTDTQNKLLAVQNAKLAQQTILAESSQVTALNGELGHVMGQVYQEARTTCLQGRLPKSLVSRCWERVAASPLQHRVEWLYAYKKQRLRDAGIAEATRRGLMLRVTREVVDGVLPISAALQGQIEALSAALHPYRVLETGTTGSDPPTRVTSLERGLLLSTLLKARVATPGTFTNAQLSFRDLTTALIRTNLDGADLRCTSLVGGRLEGSMTDVDASAVDFAGAVLVNSGPWTGSKVDSADFENATMPAADRFRIASMVGTNLSNAIVPNRHWLDDLLSSSSASPIGFVRNTWRIENSDKGWIVKHVDSGRSDKGWIVDGHQVFNFVRSIAVAGKAKVCPGQIFLQ